VFSFLHLSVGCLACGDPGHTRKDCAYIAMEKGLCWKRKRPAISDRPVSPSCIGKHALPPPLLACPITSPLSPPACAPHTPTSLPPSTPPIPSSPLPMANFALDPQSYVLVGHHIIDGGAHHLPRTFISPPSSIVRSHERFMIVEVMSAPPLDQMGQVREQVVELINHMHFHVRSAQPWISGVGLFEVRDAGERFALIQLPPEDLGQDRFVRFMKHDHGEGSRGVQGFREGCLMFLGVPLDLRNTENLRAAVNTFGKFHHWISDDPYLVRSVVFASFPDDILVPRDVVFSDYAAWGGAIVSWSAPCYILGANFAEQMPEDEDPMPIDGNPHPLPGHLIHEDNLFALPPYPALGWNDVVLPPPPMDDLNQGGGWVGMPMTKLPRMIRFLRWFLIRSLWSLTSRIFQAMLTSRTAQIRLLPLCMFS